MISDGLNPIKKGLASSGFALSIAISPNVTKKKKKKKNCGLRLFYLAKVCGDNFLSSNLNLTKLFLSPISGTICEISVYTIRLVCISIDT